MMFLAVIQRLLGDCEEWIVAIAFLKQPIVFTGNSPKQTLSPSFRVKSDGCGPLDEARKIIEEKEIIFTDFSLAVSKERQLEYKKHTRKRA